MKLYAFDTPPYSARARLAIYAKGLDIPITTPSGGTKSTEHLTINPSGRIPALILDDGTAIAESGVIVEYLEDAFPDRPLRPSDAKGKAQARLIAHVADLYISAPFDALAPQMAPAGRDQAVVDRELSKLEWGLGFLEKVLVADPLAAGTAFSTADCALIPLLYFVERIVKGLERPELLSKHAKITKYWSHARGLPLAVKVIEEIERGIAAMRAAQARPAPHH